MLISGIMNGVLMCVWGGGGGIVLIPLSCLQLKGKEREKAVFRSVHLLVPHDSSEWAKDACCCLLHFPSRAQVNVIL